MPFGRVQVIYAEKLQSITPQPEIQEQKTPTPAPSATLGAGFQKMEFSIAAPSVVEAADFLCGAYFNMVHMTSGSPISVYTKDFRTISQFTEHKQDIEAAIMKYPGTEVYLRSQGTEGLSDVTVTVSPSGNQTLSLDLHFRCAAPGTAGSSDAVFAILRPNDPRNADVISSVSSAQRVFYIISGLEKQNVFMENATSSDLKVGFLSRLTEELKIPQVKGSFSACAQIYGGLLFDRWEDGAVVCRTHANCREYMPIGCHIPVFTAITEVAGRRTEADENTRALYNMIRDCFWKNEPARISWCVSNEEDSTDETQI